jgi:hypothetical protein
MTRGQLIQMVSAKLGLDRTVGTEERSLMEQWANDGVVDVLSRTRANVELAELDLVPGEGIYRLSHDVLALLDLSVVGSGANVDPTTVEEMRRLRGNLGWAGPVRYVAVEGTLMWVFPVPETVEVLSYVYVARPEPMTTDNDDPGDPTFGGLPPEYHRAIEYYMLWQGAEYDDKQTALSPKDYRGAYEAECVDIRKRHRRKAGRKLSRIRVP